MTQNAERYLLTCHRYIELNLVRAEGMAGHPVEYRWSRYRANTLDEEKVLTPHPQYLALGDAPQVRQMAYRAWFNMHIDERSLSAIRESLNQCRALGSESFKDQIEYALARRVRPEKAGRPRKTD